MKRSVITSEQARKITDGRAPLVPVQYETAVRALQECISLDDAKIWSDKADALAAWAKIYRNDDIGRKAKILKLRAYRRMGELAAELRQTRKGGTPGPLALLITNGLRRSDAIAARKLSKISKESFEKITTQSVIRSPIGMSDELIKSGQSDTWKLLNSSVHLGGFRGYLRAHKAVEVASNLRQDEVNAAIKLAREAIEWLDELDQLLSLRTK